MAKLPAAQQYIGRGVDLPAPDLPDTCCNPACDAPAFELHHVTRRSYLNGPFSFVQLFGRVWLNVAPVCRSCHDDLEQNRTQITAHLKGSSGYYSWAGRPLDPYPNPVLEDGESHGVFPPFHAEAGSAGSPSSSTGVTEGDIPLGNSTLGRDDGSPGSESSASADNVSGDSSPSVTPGETCPECNRRVPHPRKPSSPKSKVVGFRIPVDEADDVMEAWKMRAERLGVLKMPHWQKHYLDITNSLIDGLSDDVVRAIGKDYLGDL